MSCLYSRHATCLKGFQHCNPSDLAAACVSRLLTGDELVHVRPYTWAQTVNCRVQVSPSSATTDVGAPSAGGAASPADGVTATTSSRAVPHLTTVPASGGDAPEMLLLHNGSCVCCACLSYRTPLDIIAVVLWLCQADCQSLRSFEHVFYGDVKESIAI